MVEEDSRGDREVWIVVGTCGRRRMYVVCFVLLMVERKINVSLVKISKLKRIMVVLRVSSPSYFA
jgi:hypothetical protein